jgi:hypothetical protein
VNEIVLRSPSRPVDRNDRAVAGGGFSRDDEFKSSMTEVSTSKSNPFIRLLIEMK